MTTPEIVTVSVTFLIALGGWLFAWLQTQKNHHIQQSNHERDLREKKIDRALAYLEEMADLVSLYRILANASERLVTDTSGYPVLDSSGSIQVDKRSIFPTERFDEALKELEGTDTRNFIKLQAFRIHRRLGEIGDILVDLDPCKDAQYELHELYMATVHRLEDASNGGDFDRFVKVLDEADGRRLALRQRIQLLVTQPKTQSSI